MFGMLIRNILSILLRRFVDTLLVWLVHPLILFQGARLQEREAQGYDSDSDDDDEEWAEDELGYISPLDSLDVNQTFKHSLTG